jgi:hypothetical protein
MTRSSPVTRHDDVPGVVTVMTTFQPQTAPGEAPPAEALMQDVHE